ncbi:MAG: DinB family protein [Acidobacteria bacterium]|nr:DinB family protein [Acidobacteriota bacterium]MCL5289379.1 DinB family protein [Acidobacteriota bacterium]
MNNREFFIQRLQAETPAMLKVIRALPAGKLDYRPHPRSRSAGELVAVLAAEAAACVEMCAKGEINWAEPQAATATEQAAVDYERCQKEFADLVRKADDATWDNKKVPLLMGGQKVHEGTLSGLSWEMLFDAVHHRGQLSTYIRPMGGKVPSIYGPSADDAG